MDMQLVAAARALRESNTTYVTENSAAREELASSTASTNSKADVSFEMEMSMATTNFEPIGPNMVQVQH